MNYRKAVISVLIVFLSVYGSYAAAKKRKVPERVQQPPDITRIIKKGKLVVAMTAADQAPFFFVNSRGVLTGLDVKIAREIADRLGVEVQFDRSAKSFDDVVTNVAEGKADAAISKLSRTLPRAKKVRFSTPYITFRHGLLLNRLNTARVIQELKVSEKEYIRRFTGRIGVIEHSSYETFARTNFPYAGIVSYPEWADVLNAVRVGAIDAAYRDELEIKKYLRLYPDASVKVKTVLITDKTDSIAIAVRWDDDNLLAFINMIIESGTFPSKTEDILELYADIFLTGK